MKVSVIIPTYNSERFLERTLKAVRNQVDLPPETLVEILVCDDRSTDKTIEIARKYDCVVLKNPGHTGGPNYGRNEGIRHATGDVICFLDHDDEWLPNKLSVQLKEIANGYDFVYSSCTYRQE